ncbi:MAG: hypothetical protein ACUZ8O_15735 [Candidatus Anammoxibacter sp.]
MRMNLNVFDKLLHYTENTTTGIIGREHGTAGIYTKLGASNSMKNRHRNKHFSEADNWIANKRKTKP